MTFQQQTKTVSEDILKTLSSKKGFLIGYSMNEDGDIFSSPNKCITNSRIEHGRKYEEFLNTEPIIFMHKISSKDTDYSDEYTAIRGEIIESEELLQFNRKGNVWK